MSRRRPAAGSGTVGYLRIESSFTRSPSWAEPGAADGNSRTERGQLAQFGGDVANSRVKIEAFKRGARARRRVRPQILALLLESRDEALKHGDSLWESDREKVLVAVVVEPSVSLRIANRVSAMGQILLR